MTRSPEEIIHAMRLIAEGRSRAAVSRLTGIDTKTLGRYWGRYQTEGEDAFKAKRRLYSVRFKKTVLDDIEKKGQTIAFASAKYGVPAITIKRWFTSKENGGNVGLRDGRHGNAGHFWNITRLRAGQAVALSFRSLSGIDETTVKDELEKRGVFQNSLFGTFLINLYIAYSFLVSDIKDEEKDEDDDKDRRMLAYTFARFRLSFSAAEDRARAVEGLLDLPETVAFINTYMDSILTVIETYRNRKIK